MHPKKIKWIKPQQGHGTEYTITSIHRRQGKGSCKESLGFRSLTAWQRNCSHPGWESSNQMAEEKKSWWEK